MLRYEPEGRGEEGKGEGGREGGEREGGGKEGGREGKKEGGRERGRKGGRAHGGHVIHSPTPQPCSHSSYNYVFDHNYCKQC